MPTRLTIATEYYLGEGDVHGMHEFTDMACPWCGRKLILRELTNQIGGTQWSGFFHAAPENNVTKITLTHAPDVTAREEDGKTPDMRCFEAMRAYMTVTGGPEP